MKILAIRRENCGTTIARFDAELPNGIKLLNLKLVQGRNGFRVYGPRDFAGPTITLPLEVADELAVLANNHLRAVASHANAA